MATNTTQQALVVALRKIAPEDKKLADELSGILHISKNSAYKRLSGLTPFTLEEAGQLIQHFNLPVQAVFCLDQPTFPARFSGFGTKKSSADYLLLLEKELLALTKAPHPQISYVTNGLPDFHYFYFEELTLFQLYIWERMVWDNGAW